MIIMAKFVHGTQNFGCAEIDTSGSTPTFKAPVMLEGITNFEMEVDESQSSIYADNKTYAVLSGAKVRSATATMYQITKAYSIFALGFKEAENGMLTDTGEKKQHCIFFESIEEDGDTGVKTQTLHYLYSALASEPTLSRETDAEEITPSEIEIEYTAKESSFVVDKDGIAVQYASITRTDQNAKLYDKFKTQVILPTTPIPSN